MRNRPTLIISFLTACLIPLSAFSGNVSAGAQQKQSSGQAQQANAEASSTAVRASTSQVRVSSTTASVSQSNTSSQQLSASTTSLYSKQMMNKGMLSSRLYKESKRDVHPKYMPKGEQPKNVAMAHQSLKKRSVAKMSNDSGPSPYSTMRVDDDGGPSTGHGLGSTVGRPADDPGGDGDQQGGGRDGGGDENRDRERENNFRLLRPFDFLKFYSTTNQNRQEVELKIETSRLSQKEMMNLIGVDREERIKKRMNEKLRDNLLKQKR